MKAHVKGSEKIRLISETGADAAILEIFRDRDVRVAAVDTYHDGTVNYLDIQFQPKIGRD